MLGQLKQKPKHLNLSAYVVSCLEFGVIKNLNIHKQWWREVGSEFRLQKHRSMHASFDG